MASRVLVCGGRDLTGDEAAQLVATTLYEINEERGPFECIIHGCATGVDSYAEFWAKAWHIKACGFRAEWARLGKAAGPVRNQRMLDEGKPDLVVAFPGGRGTADMVRRAKAASIEVIEVTHV